MRPSYFLLGCPVSHSLSPLIYKTAFESSALDASYEGLHVEPAALRQTVDDLRHRSNGFNVTVPYKESILPWMDEVSPDVHRIGAVNTVKVDRGRLLAFNTDWTGFSKSLEGVKLEGCDIIVLGAGGAARSVVYALLIRHAPGRIIVVNRNMDRARRLIEDMGPIRGQTRLEAGPYDRDFSFAAELVVQATPVGLQTGQSPVGAGFFKKIRIAFDLLYGETLFLKEAARAGCMTIGGIEMLIAQAAVAFSIYCGLPFPEKNVRRKLRERGILHGTDVDGKTDAS